jgi:predicted peptidase
MGFGSAVLVAALVDRAASLVVRNDEVPETARIKEGSEMKTQWSETRLGPPMLVSDACSVAWNFSTQSEWKEPEPITFPEAGLGARRLLKPIAGGVLKYQLYLPPTWNNNKLYPYPVHVDLHSHGERKFTLKNSQGLARMLARNQSQSFDNRSCWCLDSNYSTAHQESAASPYYLSATEDTGCPRADCTFADTFPGVVVMPQCWTGATNQGWTADCIEAAKNITQYVIENFNGDADKVIVSGTSEGGVGALEFARTYPDAVSAVIVTDAPTATYTSGLDGISVYVTGDASHSGIAGIDSLVLSLNGRASGVTKYTRFVSAPAAADPGFLTTDGHSADVAYRCYNTWGWAYQYKNTGGRSAWGLGPSPIVTMSR